jgi:hypothetical protein
MRSLDGGRMRSAKACVMALAIALAGAAQAQTPLDTTFTYQGQLSQLGSAANGTYDLRFRLYDDPTGGNQNGSEICKPNVAVLNGLVTVPLDFGKAVVGQNLWLEIEVRVSSGAGCGDATGYETLAPRQRLTATPYAVYSLGAASADSAANALNAVTATTATTANNALAIGGQPASNVALLGGTQTFTGAKSFTNASGTFAGNGENLLNLNATNISSGTLAAARLPLAAARTDLGNAFAAFTNTFAGSVGIGTLSPNAALHISRVGATNLGLFEGLATTTGLTIRNVSTGGRYWSIFATADGAAEGGGKLTFQDSTSGAGTRMLIDGQGFVGIGTTAPTAPLTVAGNQALPVAIVTNASAAASPGSISGPAAIEGSLTANTPGQFAPAVRGLVTSPGSNGVGVAGVHLGGGIGVFGQAGAVGGFGVYGTATSLTGITYGVIGGTNSPQGFAGYFNGARTYVSNNLGVGQLNPTAQLHITGGPANNTLLVDGALSNGTWLNLANTSTNGRQWNLISTGSGNSEGAGKLLIRDNNAAAVRMMFDNAGNIGIGTTTPTTMLDVRDNDPLVAVSVQNASSTGAGDVMNNTAAISARLTAGVPGEFAAAVRGIVTSTSTANGFGVAGVHLGTGYAVYAESRGVQGVGVYAEATNNNAVGVYGLATAPVGTTFGVAGLVTSPTGYSGYFQGGRTYIERLGVGTSAPTNALSVAGNANITGTISKSGGSFKIDHPLDPANKFLYHSFVESPDMLNIYNGNATTDERGYATIEMPDYFGALNREFRYQLTVIDGGEGFVLAKVSREIEGNTFEIRTSEPNTKVSWQVTGVRKDAWAERNRIPTSIDKSPEERGLYLHPEVFGQPADKAIYRKAEPLVLPHAEWSPR